MLLEQPTNHKSLIQKLNQHFEASTGPPTYFDFETKCTKQGLHCEFPITLENAIFIKTRNGELCNEVIQKNGKLKMVRETAKAFRIAKQGNYMITSGNSKVQEGEQLNAKDRNKLNKIARPGQHSMRNSTPDKDTSRPTTKLCCIRCGNTAHPKGGVCKNFNFFFFYFFLFTKYYLLYKAKTIYNRILTVWYLCYKILLLYKILL